MLSNSHDTAISATCRINEFNGAGQTETTNISNSNMGSTDAANLDPVVYPLVPGNYSYEKFQKLEVTNMGGSSKIDNIKVWRTGALGADATQLTNARETGYAGAAVYHQPVATVSSLATETMPSSVPTGANLGIAGSLASGLVATGYSDFLVMQLGTSVAAISGSTSTISYRYSETA